MTRIFASLALFAFVLLAGNFLFALFVGDFGASSRNFQAAFGEYQALRLGQATREQLDEAEQASRAALAELNEQRFRFRWHIRLGIAAGLVTLLVNSISITYFIGTNRWSREVVEAFSLDESLALRSQELKRRAFPWALGGILCILAVSGLGAAADPATLNPNAADWVAYHWSLALVGLVVIGLCFVMQAGAIGQNSELIQKILRAAEEERERRRQLRESRPADSLALSSEA